MNLRQYGVNVVIPTELAAIDYRALSKDNKKVWVITPIGKFEIAFDSLEKVDQFIGDFTRTTGNIDIKQLMEEKIDDMKKNVKSVIIKP